MATDLENLQARKAAILAELAALDTTKAGGLPNASGPGVNVDHVGYRDSLYRELEKIDQLIAAAEGPFEVEMRGET
jgi:hypothetical protein